MADKHKILIVEDDKYIINFISMSLKKEDYDYVIAKTCGEANALFYANRPDMIILDLGLPDGDGIEIIKNVREISKIPIIVVSARQEEEEKIQALDLGADDYVTKPFTPMELLARVNSQLRRYRMFAEKLRDREENQNIHVIGGLELNEDTVEVSVDGEPVRLTPIEYKILLLLMKSPGRVFSAEEIYERVWNEKAINTDTIMVHIRNIREKIESCPKEPKYLKVVWGVGYKIEKQA